MKAPLTRFSCSEYGNVRDLTFCRSRLYCACPVVTTVCPVTLPASVGTSVHPVNCSWHERMDLGFFWGGEPLGSCVNVNLRKDFDFQVRDHNWDCPLNRRGFWTSYQLGKEALFLAKCCNKWLVSELWG